MCLDGVGDRECPADWPIKHVFYSGADDTRACTPCTCGAPAGGSCSTFVSIYENAGCSMLLKTEKVSSAGPLCSDVQPAGTALGSVLVDKLTYTAGACPPSGGDPTGAVAPKDPTTFCCRP